MEIIFENEDFILINKPDGMLSIPRRGTIISEDSVYSLLKEKYKNIYIVHRLDKETSGLLIFAKNPETHSYLCNLFETHNIEKKYIAFVHGIVDGKNGIINKRLKEFSSGRVGVNFNGKDSITEYKVIKKFRNYSLLDIKLLTGRRHQIRVHLYSIGHPVVGDKLYGDIEEQKKYPRLMLHSYKLGFNYKGEKYSFKSEPDENFKNIINSLT